MGLREQKKQQTRQSILSVASKLFDQQGFLATTADDIAAQAEISRMTFFNYFSSKEKVLEALALDWFSQHRSLFEIMIGDEGSVETASPPNLEKRLKVIIENRKFLKMIVQHTRLFNNFAASSEHSFESVAPFIQSHFQNRLNRVSKAQQQGVIRDDIEATEICHIYDAVRNDVVGRWLMEENASPALLKQHFNAAMRLFYSGLKTR